VWFFYCHAKINLPPWYYGFLGVCLAIYTYIQAAAGRETGVYIMCIPVVGGCCAARDERSETCPPHGTTCE
jgi:hypothetical protein